MEVSDTVAELIATVKAPSMTTSSPGCGTTPPLHLVGSSQLPPALLIQVRTTCAGSTQAENSDVLPAGSVAVALTTWPSWFFARGDHDINTLQHHVRAAYAHASRMEQEAQRAQAGLREAALYTQSLEAALAHIEAVPPVEQSL